MVAFLVGIQTDKVQEYGLSASKSSYSGDTVEVAEVRLAKFHSHFFAHLLHALLSGLRFSRLI